MPLLCMLLVSVLAPAKSDAQNFALKTNLLYDATATVNLGFEVPMGRHWSFDLSGNYNGWKFHDNMKWKHWLVQPEFRYWFCDRMMGHFIGFHFLGGQYNIGNVGDKFWEFSTGGFLKDQRFTDLADHRYEGWMAGAGIVYGYSWVLGKHWNLEFEIGVGYLYGKYDKFKCENCGDKVESDKEHHYVGPTKTAINLVYVF